MEEESNSKELTGSEATRFRAVAARANYLSADRPDIQYAVKEVCRRMAKPVEGDWQKLARLGPYLRGAPRCVMEYRWQQEARPQSATLTAIGPVTEKPGRAHPEA